MLAISVSHSHAARQPINTRLQNLAQRILIDGRGRARSISHQKLRESAIHRLRAFLFEAKRLKTKPFPYPHAKEVVERIERKVIECLADLEALPASADPETIKTGCSVSLRLVMDYTPLLGFISRSTSTRNSFETYGPLLRLAHAVLGPSGRLVISSEWDYTPFVLLYGDLNGFVFLGLPAPEAGNPKLTSIAGHELGHPLWTDKDLKNRYSAEISVCIRNRIEDTWNEYNMLFPEISREKFANPFDPQVSHTWLLSWNWALRQLEETFCDLVGLVLFGEAFLHACAYLIGPNTGRLRSPEYPNLRRRFENLRTAAGTFDYQFPNEYLELVQDDPAPQGREIGYSLSLADFALQRFFPSLIEEIGKIATEKHLPKPNYTRIRACCENFKNMIPAPKECNLADIINAAWKFTTSQWSNEKHIAESDHARILSDLVLKSFEAIEIRERLR
ncbi:hypothetical protein RAS2_01270 [Phycisphaerae bacterium RAS2]|nr:hypothetical protein RAS2_01270 [Phycisphaerae bacterium RAS2]